MSIAIIIPVFDRFNFLPPLLNQLAQQTVLPTTVIIVDHGHNSLTLETSWPFSVEIIKRDSSLWFAAATNEGLRHARAANFEFLVILNDDVRLGCDQWLAKMQAFASEPNTLVASCAIDASGNVLYKGVRFDRFRFGYRSIGRGQRYLEGNRPPIECDVLPTRGIMLRSDLLDRIGLLDAQLLPHHSSDYEWTSRAKRRGIRLLMAQDACVVTAIEIPQPNRPATLLNEFSNFVRNQHHKGSLPVAWAFSGKAFRQPYRSFFLAAHCARFLLKCAQRRLSPIATLGGTIGHREA